MPIQHAELDQNPTPTSNTPTPAPAPTPAPTTGSVGAQSTIVEPLTPSGTTSGNVGSPLAQGVVDTPAPTHSPTSTSVIVEPITDSGIAVGQIGSPMATNIVTDVVEPKPKPINSSGASVISEPLDTINPKPKHISAPFGVQSIDSGIIVVTPANVLDTTTTTNPSPSSLGGGGGGGGGATSDDNSSTDTNVVDDVLGQRKRNIIKIGLIGVLAYFLFFNKNAE